MMNNKVWEFAYYDEEILPAIAGLIKWLIGEDGADTPI